MTGVAPTNPPSSVKERDHPSPPRHVELLLRLEKGLKASQEALLSRDLHRMRELTAEQNFELRSISLNSACDEDSKQQRFASSALAECIWLFFDGRSNHSGWSLVSSLEQSRSTKHILDPSTVWRVGV